MESAGTCVRRLMGVQYGLGSVGTQITDLANVLWVHHQASQPMHSRFRGKGNVNFGCYF